MRSAVIVNQFSAMNSGDAAILRATANLLRQHGFQRIVNATRFYKEDREYDATHGIETCPPLIRFAPRSRVNPIVRLLFLLISVLGVVVVISISRVSSATAIKFAKVTRQDGLVDAIQADLIVFAGGGYLWSAKGAYDFSLWHALSQMWISRYLKKRAVMMPVSVGKITGGVSTRMFKNAFGWLSEIVVRDAPSIDETQRLLRGSTPPTVLIPDIVIGAHTESSAEQNPGFIQRVIIVPMNWLHTRNVTDQQFEQYLQKLAIVTEILADKGVEVVLAGTAEVEGLKESDFNISERIYDKLPSSIRDRVAVARPETMENGLEGLISGASLLIGTRLHSCILAMNSGVPAIALAYTDKVNGTYSLLGIEEYCFDVEAFEAEEVISLARQSIWSPEIPRSKFKMVTENARLNVNQYYSEALRMKDAAN